MEEQCASLEPAALLSLGLTLRESQVLSAAASGKNIREIAAALAISPRTAQTHLQGVYRKLSVDNRAAAVAAAFRADQAVRPARQSGDDVDPRAHLAARLAAIRAEAPESGEGKRP